MVSRHFGDQLLLADVATIDEVGKQRVDQSFLVGVGVLLVTLALPAPQEIERRAKALFAASAGR